MPKFSKQPKPKAVAIALVPGESMTITMFCARHHLSRRAFYNLPPSDRPKVMRIGASQRITQAAEAEWAERLTEKVA
jgi:hypothetical protein